MEFSLVNGRVKRGPGVEKKSINHELWQACAGPLVNLPQAGTHVVYFPQGHSEQVCALLLCAVWVPLLNVHSHSFASRLSISAPSVLHFFPYLFWVYSRLPFIPKILMVPFLVFFSFSLFKGYANHTTIFLGMFWPLLF